MLKSLSPIDVALIKKIGGNGSSYTLPIASSTQLGGVQPVAKTDAMTQEVGVDEAGGLWTAPGGGDVSSNQWRFIAKAEVTEDVGAISVSVDENSEPFELEDVAIVWSIKRSSASTTTNGGLQLRFYSGFKKAYNGFSYSNKPAMVSVIKQGCYHLIVDTTPKWDSNGNINSGNQYLYPSCARGYGEIGKNRPINIIEIATNVDTEMIASGSWIEIYGRG